MMKHVQLAIIGGGPAGLAAAIAARSRVSIFSGSTGIS